MVVDFKCIVIHTGYNRLLIKGACYDPQPQPPTLFKHMEILVLEFKSYDLIHSIEMRRFCARRKMEIWLKILVGVIFFRFS